MRSTEEDGWIAHFPVVPRFYNDENGHAFCYEDGTPTLTVIMNTLLAMNPDTAKFNDIVVKGSMGVPREDIIRRGMEREKKGLKKGKPNGQNR